MRMEHLTLKLIVLSCYLITTDRRIIIGCYARHSVNYMRQQVEKICKHSCRHSHHQSDGQYYQDIIDLAHGL